MAKKDIRLTTSNDPTPPPIADDIPIPLPSPLALIPPTLIIGTSSPDRTFRTRTGTIEDTGDQEGREGKEGEGEDVTGCSWEGVAEGWSFESGEGGG